MMKALLRQAAGSFDFGKEKRDGLWSLIFLFLICLRMEAQQPNASLQKSPKRRKTPSQFRLINQELNCWGEGQEERKETEMSSHAQQANDPRMPSAARAYKPPVVVAQDLPVDYSGFIAVVFGVFGAMFRYKLCSWLAIIFSAQALANMRNFENDFKQISMAMMFGIMGLVTSYLGLGPKAKR